LVILFQLVESLQDTVNEFVPGFPLGLG